MADAVYWTTRTVLIAAWLLCAYRAWHKRSTWPRAWATCAAAAVTFASLRIWRWNYHLLQEARHILNAVGVYDDRRFIKYALAGGLLVVFVVGLRLRRVFGQSPAARTCCMGLALQAALIAIWTFSLDDALPRVLAEQPGRYLMEATFVTIALIGTIKQPPTSEPPK